MQEEQSPVASIPEVYATIVPAWSAFVQGMIQALSEAVSIAQSVCDACWQAYRDAGMPYGESQEGLQRWMHDLSEIQRHEQEIERIREHHDTLISARKLGEEMRARPHISKYQVPGGREVYIHLEELEKMNRFAEI